MLSAEIHKDLTKYKAKVVAGLSARTLACIALAVGSAVLCGFYFTWVLGIDFDVVSWLIYGITVPFWALGFLQPKGMEVEEWLPLWIRQKFGESRLTYENHGRYEVVFGTNGEATHCDGGDSSRVYREFAKKQRAIELWKPGEESEKA